MLGDTSQMTPKQREAIAKKLGIDEKDLDQYSGQVVPINAKNYADFKRQYDQLWRYEGSVLQQEAGARIASYGKTAKTSDKAIEKSARSSKMKSQNMSDVATGGKRNEEPLSDAQIKEAKEAARKQGYEGDIIYSPYSNTSFHGSTEGEP